MRLKKENETDLIDEIEELEEEPEMTPEEIEAYEQARLARKRSDRKWRLAILIIVVIVIIGYFVYSALVGDNSCARTESQSARKKITTEYDMTSYFDKTSEYSDKDYLYERMSVFLARTGIQPFMHDLTNEETQYSEEELQVMADEFYKATFPDECHMLLFFQHHRDGSYALAIHFGEETYAVMDEEAILILRGNIARYMNDASVPVEKKLGHAFAYATQEIMGTSGASNYMYIIAILVVFITFGAVIRRRFHAFKKDPNYLGRPDDEAYRRYSNSDERFY